MKVVSSIPGPCGPQVHVCAHNSEEKQFLMLCLWCSVYSTAKEVEAIVRKEGATPATVGVIEGEVRVGLTSKEIDHLAQCKSSVKVSRRDLPCVLSKV